MCGLFGYSGSRMPDPSDICLGIWDAEERGSHSTGVYGAFLWKKALPANKFIEEERDNIERACKAYNIIGHTRHATMGAKTTELAHPFVVGKIVGTHNGWIPELKFQLAKLEQKMPEVDSHVIYRTLKKKNYNLSALELIEGSMALAWVYEDKLHLYRRESKPLFIGYKSPKQIFYSSREKGLKLVGCSKIEQTTENMVYIIKNGVIKDIVQIADPKITIPMDCLPSFFRTKSTGDHIIPREYDVIEDPDTGIYRFMTEEEKKARDKKKAKTHSHGHGYNNWRNTSYNRESEEFKNKGPYSRMLPDMAKAWPTDEEKDIAKATVTIRLVDHQDTSQPLGGYVLFTKYSPMIYGYKDEKKSGKPIDESIKGGFITNEKGLLTISISSYLLSGSRITFYFSAYGLNDVVWQYDLDVPEDVHTFKSITIDVNESISKNPAFGNDYAKARATWLKNKKIDGEKETKLITSGEKNKTKKDKKESFREERSAYVNVANKNTSKLFEKDGAYNGSENIVMLLEETPFVNNYFSGGKLWGGLWHEGHKWKALIEKVPRLASSDREVCSQWLDSALREAGIKSDSGFKTTRMYNLIADEFKEGKIPYTHLTKALNVQHEKFVGLEDDDEDDETIEDKFVNTSGYEDINNVLSYMTEIGEVIETCEHGICPEIDIVENAKSAIDAIKDVIFKIAGVTAEDYEKSINN